MSHPLNDLRDGEGAHQHRHDLEPRQHVGPTEGVAWFAQQRVEADHRHGKTDQARDPALDDKVLGHQRARQQDAEEREQRLFRACDVLRQQEQQPDEDQEGKRADQGADETGGRGQTQRLGPAARPRQRVAVHRGGGTRGRAGDVEQDRRVGPSVDRADVGAQKRDQRVVERDLVAEKTGQDRYCQRRGQTRQRAEGDAEKDRDDQVDIGQRVDDQPQKGVAEPGKLRKNEIHSSPSRAGEG
jgi:hypothetical protein